MIDKTKLELDIERHEMYRTPFCISLLVIILTMALITSGIYIYKLRREIEERDLKISLMKEDFKKEKAELLKRIRETHHPQDQAEGL